MIRIEIIAHNLSAAEDLADLLAADDRIEVVEAYELDFVRRSTSSWADVFVAMELLASQLPTEGCPVVVVSGETGAYSYSAASLVHAWLPVNSSAPEIAAAVIAASAGLYTLTADQFRPMSMRLAGADDDSTFEAEKLTPRELEILNLMSDGLSNKQIAAILKISDHTAKFHVAQVSGKLGASNRTEAVLIGIRRGLVAL